MSSSEDKYKEISPSERVKLDDLIKHFDDFKKKLEKCDYTHKKEEYFHIMRDFREYITKFDDNLYKIFWHSKYYDYYRSFFQQQNNYYIRAMEAAEAFSIMTKQPSMGKGFLDLIDREFIRDRYCKKSEEIGLIDFSAPKTKTLVMIGSGPMPETMLYIYENTGVREIVGIDNNQEAIYISSELISSLGVEKIKFVHIDALDYDYKDADIVHIAIFVSPKDKILARIAETANDDVQISVESPKGLYRMLYDDACSNLHRLLKISAHKEFKNPYIQSEIFLLTKHHI